MSKLLLTVFICIVVLGVAIGGLRLVFKIAEYLEENE